jgi:hypothetical protein
MQLFELQWLYSKTKEASDREGRIGNELEGRGRSLF